MFSVGRQKYKDEKSADAALYCGAKAIANMSDLKLSYPITHGIITKWNEMEYLWSQIFEEIKVNYAEQPILLTEAVLNPCLNRKKMAEIFFEKFNVPSLLICSQASLPLYSFGKSTGVVLECGDGVSQCSCIYEGFILNNTAARIDLGGRDITNYLNLLLRKNGYIFSKSVPHS